MRVGPVQSKVISLLIFAPLILTPFTAAHATDYPPSLPNSNVFTTSSEAPKVEGPTGAFTQRIPLDIPPGRIGLQPDLSLDYNSQRTQDGIVGYGWSLSIPYIERLNKTGSQDMYGPNAYFTSSIEGELAVAPRTLATVDGTSTVSVLVVGGGGGGGGSTTGQWPAGGGGAGDYVASSSVALVAQEYTITVGDGGSAGSGGGSSTAGGNGNPSSIAGSGFTTIIALGGGGGANGPAGGAAGVNGASGGGASYNHSGGAATGIMGHKGGDCAGPFACGGGGAGTAGVDRAGPVCLNNFSASISGASAGVRLPSGGAAG